MKNPVQPLEQDKNGRLRFKENAIVRYLLDNGGIDMNQLAMLDFSNDDRVQFAQLIGYSLGGYGDLSYVSDYDYSVAEAMSEENLSEDKIRIAHLEAELLAIRESFRAPVARLFGVHEDDLGD